jgi:hypothetical protein
VLDRRNSRPLLIAGVPLSVSSAANELQAI